MFDYFYGAQSEQFAFYRVPKVLFTNDRFKYLSAEAKTLYGILLDRVPLSAKNGWIDEQGRVYIICTIEEIMADMNCGNKKAVQLLAELETKVGLIERKRQGLGKPNLIYVKNFISVDDPVERHFLKCQNDTSGSVERTSLEVSKGHGTNTDMNNTEYERDRKGSIQTTQEVEIYFNFVGRFVPPAFGEVELTPEELEEIRKREERKDRLHQNYLKRKASGAQKRYEDKIKGRKKAEIEAKKAAIRAEDIAKGVFVPVSSLPQREPMKGVQTA